jgi:hypothetical protein
VAKETDSQDPQQSRMGELWLFVLDEHSDIRTMVDTSFYMTSLRLLGSISAMQGFGQRHVSSLSSLTVAHALIRAWT